MESRVSAWITLPIVRMAATQVRDSLQIDEFYALTSYKAVLHKSYTCIPYYIMLRPCHRRPTDRPLANVTWSEAISREFSVLSHVIANNVILH